MKTILRTILLNAGSIYLLSLVFSGVRYGSLLSLLGAAIILGFLNTFVRPVLKLLTMPINLLTFGLFSLVLNIFILFLVTKIVSGFTITPFTLNPPSWAPQLFLPIALGKLGALLIVSLSLNVVNSLVWYVFS